MVLVTDTKSEFHLDVTASGASSIDLLANASGYSKSTIKRAMQCGAVWLTRTHKTNRLRRVNKELLIGDELHLYFNPETINSQPPAAELIADFNSYSIWHKPRGMLSQGSKWGDHWTINRWVETHITTQRPTFIVHRLDRATSGLMILAHSKKIAAVFSRKFENREIDKNYTAIVEGIISFGDQPRTIATPVNDKPAISHIHLLGTDGHNSLLRIHIETGRKHQIRQHLSSIGLPIIGDRLYGTKKHKDDLQLTASKLSFICPLSHEKRQFELKAEQLPKLSRIHGNT